MLGQDTYNEILNEDLGIYKGAIYENMIADAQIKNGKNLYYFSKDSGFEVKAKNGTAKSLKEVINNTDYSINKGIKLIDGNIGNANNICTLPLYMGFLLK